MNKIQRQEMIKVLLSRCDEDTAMSITELYEHLVSQGVSCNRKTIERDIMDLSIEGVTQSEAVNPSRFYMSQDYKGHLELTFSKPELQMMLLSLHALKDSGPEYFRKMAENTTSKILNQLKNEQKKVMLDFSKQFVFSTGIQPKSQAHNQKDFEVVLTALREGTSFQCFYSSPYQRKEEILLRHFTPYLFFLNGFTPYICCYDHDSKTLKNLRISRIDNALIEKTPASPDLAVQAKAMIAQGFGAFSAPDLLQDLHLLIEGKFLTYCREQIIHPTQSLEMVNDKQATLSLSVPVSYELVRLLASFGDDILSISPKEVSDQVSELAQKTVDNMKKSS